MKRFATWCAVATFASLSAFTGSASAAIIEGFGVSPLRFDADVRPGGQAKFQVTISNTDNAPTGYSFSVVDIRGDKDDPAATPKLFAGKMASSISAHDWVDPPENITIPGGQDRKVSFTIRVPSDAKGGHYAALVVQGRAVDIGAGLAVSRIAVPLLLNAGGTPPPEIKITEIKEYTDGGTRVVYTNDGQTHTTPKGTVTVRDPITGKIIKKIKSGDCSTALPGSVGECIFPGSEGGAKDGSGTGGSGSGSGKEGSARGDGLGGVGPTGGFVELVTDEGARARGDLPTEWAGTWTSMLLPLAGVVLFVMYFLFLRRRRKDNENAEEDGNGDGDENERYGYA